MLSAFVLLAASQLLPYPGNAYLGELKAKEGSCRVAAWEGMAPALWLFSDQEKRELEAVLREAEASQTASDQANRSRLALRRYLGLLQENQPGVPPLFLGKRVYYLALALSCEGEMVRAGLAVLPRLYGTALVAVHPATGSHLWIGEFVRQSDMQVFREAIEALRDAQLWATANGTPGPAEGGASGAGKEAAKKQVESTLSKLADYRFQLWNLEGRSLANCPEKCDPAELQAAWAAVPEQARKVFKPLLGALSRRAQEEEGEFTPPAPGNLFPPRLLYLWPAHLGGNPFLEAEWQAQATGRMPTFAAPSPELCLEIFGTQRPRLPEFDDPMPARVFTVMSKSIR